MIVCKFGGTSVADAAAIGRVIDIIAAKRDRQPVVVVSALGGATNQLLDVAHKASQGELLAAVQIIEQLRERHLREAATLLDGAPDAEELAHEIGVTFDELAHLAEAFRTLGYLTPRSLDTVAAIGELLSSQIVAAAFRHRGFEADFVDARDVVRTNDFFTKAEPDVDGIAQASQQVLLPLIQRGRIPVVGGFVGATASRVTTTLGRGGSDFSASLIGAAIDAEAIEIWTDVDGMLTADPRVIPTAQLIERISFEEAAELAAFGAKVLHPATIAPAVQRGIPVYVFNSRRPEGKGTMIAFDAPRLPVRAIAGKRSATMVKLRSSRMLLAPGFLRRVFEVFERHRTSVDVVTTSEVSVSVTLDDTHNLAAILQDLAEFGDVSVERRSGVLAVVGAGLADGSAALAQAMAALGPIKVHMASLSATGINFTLVVDDEQVVPAMQRLHATFFETQS
ncbi:lysine-sensitive aspartokinase 3 [Gemmatimonas sp. UBA7669]|uniref:lysine-sensitive aspartokinase 3 n=1 Tax=Gemmatimonas sp. UBA7669 TaxID=1946568 RepID=UPI0025C365A5|nr:lysine-sensitive aspartokinase 3 [Gemmatimonas sp. UBA7669]